MTIKTEYNSWMYHAILIAGCLLISCEDPGKGKEDCFGYVDDGDPHLPNPAYPSPYSAPSWSTDGKTIVFFRMKVISIGSIGNYSIDPDSTGIWRINPDGSDMRLILRGGGYRSPDLSPDGKWLAFKFGGQVYKAPFMNGQIDTTGFVQLTSVGSNHFPAWSPDGEWIAYDSNADSSNGMNFIWKMNVDGSEKKRIAYEPAMGEIRMPHWSLDGTKIVHIRYLVGTFSSEIFLMDSSGTNPLRLTFNNATDYYPKYSPDGKKIAFTSQPEECPMQIWTINTDGTGLKQLIHEGASSKPSWSPDGRIVYAHYVSRKLDVNHGTLWVMDGDGGNQQQLTFNHGLILDP